LANMRIDILRNGVVIYAVTADVCEVASISNRQERKAFDFVASEFSFSLSNAEAIYAALVSDGVFLLGGVQVPANELCVVVQDDTTVWFRGYLSAEGSGYKAGEGKIQFRAVSASKNISESLAETPMTFLSLQPDMVLDSHRVTLTMSDAIHAVTGCDTVSTDFTDGNPAFSYYVEDEANDYSVYEFLQDCAFQKNAVLWIDEYNRIRMKSRSLKTAATEVSSELIFSWSGSPRGKDYSRVLWSTTSTLSASEIQDLVNGINDMLKKLLNEPNSQQWKDKLKEYTSALARGTDPNGRIVIIEETLTSAKLLYSMPENYDYKYTLDARVPRWARGKTEAIGNSMFTLPAPVVSSTNFRRGDWDLLMRPKHITEIGLIGLTKYEPYTKIKCRDIVGNIIETQYDIVKETTTITVESGI